MDISVEDLLQSMSQTLLTTQPTKSQPINTIPDRPFHMKLLTKPPREMFYRKTLVIDSKPEIQLLPERCSCQFVCFGAKATVKCLNCAVFDPLGLSSTPTHRPGEGDSSLHILISSSTGD